LGARRYQGHLPLPNRPAFAHDHPLVYPAPPKGGFVPRRKSLVSMIREMVQEEVRSAIQSLLGVGSAGKTKPRNGRRRRRKTRGKWRPGGPGRPPQSVSEKAAGKKRGRGTRRPKSGRR